MKPKSLNPRVIVTVRLPVDIAAWLESISIDPASGQLPYGARNTHVEAALRLYRKELEKSHDNL